MIQNVDHSKSMVIINEGSTSMPSVSEGTIRDRILTTLECDKSECGYLERVPLEGVVRPQHTRQQLDNRLHTPDNNQTTRQTTTRPQPDNTLDNN